MFKKAYKRVLSVALCTFLVLGITNGFQINRKVQASSSFAKGADVGWLSQMEANNYTFKDKDGNVKDCLSILKGYGIDSIRLRAWVNPSLTDKVNGHCSTAETVAMAVKAKNMGFRIMIDLHYSDTWADPSKQVKPAAWANDTFAVLKADVYNYTLEVMNALKTEGVTPEWVQVGNETNPGMLLPEGSISDFSKLTELINQGSRAVKAVDPNTKVIIHIANGYDNVNFRKYFDALTTNKAEYDVIGMSYYPYWSNVDYTTNIDALGINLNDMAARYGKEVMVVEVGGIDTAPINTYNMLLAVQAKVKAVPNNMGTGVFYWEPEGEKSWSGYALSAWGADGRPTKAMEAFIPGAVEYNPYPVTSVALNKTSATFEVGDTLALTPTITPSNATITGVKYTTSSSVVAKVDGSTGVVTGLVPGTSTITVTTLDGGKVSNCTVTVTANTKLVTNYSFELGLNNWVVTGDTAVVSIDTDKHSGSAALHYYSGDAKNFAVSQKMTGLKNGSYKLSAWVSGGGGETTSKIYATTSTNTFETPFKNSGWDVWTKPIVNNIQVTDGTLTIGANLGLRPGNWGNIDEFELTKNEDTSLSDLKVEGATIEEFSPDVTSYNVELPAGTTIVPAVTATTISGTVVIKPAQILPGQTTVVVSNGDITKTYTIKFSVLVYNPIKNPGFEPDTTSWTISDPDAINSSNDKHSGTKALGYYKNSAFTLTASQSITGLSNGTYSLSAWAQGQAVNSKVNQIFAINSKSEKLTADFANTGWAVWSKATINNIIVTDGTLTIGSYLDANAGDWGSYDDFELIQTSTETATMVVAGIKSVIAPLKDVATLSLPVVPAGFTIAIKSTTPAGIIEANGTINLPAIDTTIGLVFTVTKTVDGTKADTKILNIVVPAKTIVIPKITAATIAAGITRVVAPLKDVTTLSFPIVPAGFTIAIKSVTPAGIVEANGTINLPTIDTTVGLVFTVIKTEDGTASDTKVINVVIPSKTKVVQTTSDTTVAAVGIIDKKVFDDIKGTDKNIIFKGNGITWTFNGKDITNPMSIDLSLKAVTQKLKDKIAIKVKALTGTNQNTFIFSFTHEGDLPGVANVKIYLGKEWANKAVSLRRYLSDKNTVESVLNQDVLQVDAEGYITFKIDHCSDYFLTEAKLPKTGSPMDMEVILLIGGLLIFAGLFLTFKQKSIKK